MRILSIIMTLGLIVSATGFAAAKPEGTKLGKTDSLDCNKILREQQGKLKTIEGEIDKLKKNKQEQPKAKKAY